VKAIVYNNNIIITLPISFLNDKYFRENLNSKSRSMFVFNFFSKMVRFKRQCGNIRCNQAGLR
jgi:hypothetical protein